MNIKKQIKDKEKELLDLRMQLNIKRSNRTILCESCGKRHKIKDLTAIQTYWYVEPHGCTGGDYWNEGEIQFICPKTDVKNRLLFTNPPYGKYNTNQDFSYVFKRIYTSLFKKVIKDYDKDKRDWVNNFNVNKNKKHYELI